MVVKHLFCVVWPHMNNTIGLIDILRSASNLRIKVLKCFDYFLGSLLTFLLPKAAQKSFSPQEIKHLLVIRPGGIGDAVLLLPVLNQIKKQYPEIHIDILCEQRNAQVFCSQASWRTSTYCYDRFNELSTVLGRRYDVVVDTEQWHYLSVILGYFLKRQALIGFGTRPLRRRLLNGVCEYDHDAYELDNFENLFGAWQLDHAEIILEGSWGIDQDLKIETFDKIKGRYAVLSPTASIPERQLTQAQISTIVNGLKAQGWEVMVLNSQMKLLQSAAMIQDAEFFIGVDSGLLHVAAALDKPVVGLFGPGRVLKWAPQGKKHHIIYNKLACSPCTRFGYTLPTCQGRITCMRDLNIDMAEILRRVG